MQEKAPNWENGNRQLTCVSHQVSLLIAMTREAGTKDLLRLPHLAQEQARTPLHHHQR